MSAPNPAAASANKQFRWKSRSQDIQLMKIVHDNLPYMWPYGSKDQNWDKVAKDMAKCEGLSANEVANIDSILF